MVEDKYRNCCFEVHDYINNYDFRYKKDESIDDIVRFVEKQIKKHRLDKNEFISVLIPYLNNNLSLLLRGCVDVFELFEELRSLMDDTPAPVQPPQLNVEGVKVLRQRLSQYLDNAQLDLLLSQLPTIPCRDLKRQWYNRYFEDRMTATSFFDLCLYVVPYREGEGRGKWNYNNFKSV